MDVIKTQIKVRDLVKGYHDDPETNQVVGYDGKLSIRPAFQRQFVYKDNQRDEVIRTINKGFPLSIFYWAKTPDGWEILDGQQRTISICQYVNGDFSLDYRYFHNLTEEEKNKILDYELDVYLCDGTDAEKMEWFKVINIAGEKLTDQELRNAVYAGSWLSEAKKKFSARNCAAERIAKDYLSGTQIRQDYLETAIKWIAKRDGVSVEEYMAKHQHDTDADEMWQYFSKVIEWVKSMFPNYRKEMKGLEWGYLFEEYGSKYYSAAALESGVKRLMMDDDVTAKKGIYEYVLSEGTKEKALNIRAFTPNMKREAYERQDHKCPFCVAAGNNTEYAIEEMEGDHITPWHLGGKTIAENCQILCKKHNRDKSGI